MECEHPLKFWAVYRTVVFSGGVLTDFAHYYRCPLCGRKMEMYVRPLARALYSLALLIGAALAVVIAFYLSFPRGWAVFGLLCIMAFQLCLMVPVCRIGLRYNLYELEGTDASSPL